VYETGKVVDFLAWLSLDFCSTCALSPCAPCADKHTYIMLFFKCCTMYVLITLISLLTDGVIVGPMIGYVVGEKAHEYSFIFNNSNDV
jgi:hypothetical protein